VIWDPHSADLLPQAAVGRDDGRLREIGIVREFTSRRTNERTSIRRAQWGEIARLEGNVAFFSNGQRINVHFPHSFFFMRATAHFFFFSLSAQDAEGRYHAT